MRHKMRDKRGISPLIATVLVIGFTIALALVIFTWGKTFTQTLTEDTGQKAEQQLGCLQANLVSFEIKKACYSGNSVKFTLENKGDTTLDKITLRITGEDVDKVDVKEVDLNLVPLNIKSFTETFNTESVGSVATKVELLRPVFTQKGKPVVCGDISEEASIAECE